MIPKFRAWDEKHNEMIRVVSINFEEKFVRGLSEVESNLDMESSYDFSEIELLQSTGLKDKNNVEIFEGDIVKVQAEDTEPKMRADRYEIGVIIYSYGSFDIETKPNTVSGLIPESNLTDIRLTLEVIGNKYEHPHLLEE